MTKIALEDNLTHLKEPLKEQGYIPVSMSTKDEVDAIIVSGERENMMNIEDTSTSVPVVDARGLDADEVVREINHRLKESDSSRQ